MPFGFPKRDKASPQRPPAPPEDAILAILDQGCRDFVFPMLDNGYVYLAASRLSLHRSEADWALVFEIFGFSPRSGVPDIAIWSLGSHLDGRRTRADYVDEKAYRAYLRVHPNDDAAFFQPFDDGWQDPDNHELVASGARLLTVRGKPLAMPAPDTLRRAGIEPSASGDGRIHTFEVCRYVAAIERDLVLATPDERRVHVPPDLAQILVLDDWHHPDTVTGQVASETAAFRSVARVLATGDVTAYDASEPGNTHWSNWPDGGSL
ncbi:MAG TPA: hypothetical protein VGM28_11235 [Candidatus Limnocylindrales bacterium]|jgi:hypothetical protein